MSLIATSSQVKVWVIRVCSLDEGEELSGVLDKCSFVLRKHRQLKRGPRRHRAQHGANKPGRRDVSWLCTLLRAINCRRLSVGCGASPDSVAYPHASEAIKSWKLCAKNLFKNAKGPSITEFQYCVYHLLELMLELDEVLLTEVKLQSLISL